MSPSYWTISVARHVFLDHICLLTEVQPMSSFTHMQHQWGLRVCSDSTCWCQTQVVLLLALKSIWKWPDSSYLTLYIIKITPKSLPLHFAFVVVEKTNTALQFDFLISSRAILSCWNNKLYLSSTVGYFCREVKVYWLNKVFLSPKCTKVHFSMLLPSSTLDTDK